MKNKKTLTAALAFSMFTGLALADELDVLALKSQQQATDLFLLSEAKAQNTPVLKIKPADCLGTILPDAPKQPNFTATYAWGDGDSASLTFWRETCKNGKDKVLLFRATPKGTPFICASSFKVVQNDKQYDAWFADGVGGHFCGDLIVSKTFVFDEYPGELFNPAAALTLYANSKKLLNIPLTGIIKPVVTGISGAINGYTNFSHTCKNISTGAIKSFPPQTVPAFNCTGLIMKKGQKIQTTITGVVK